MIYGMKRKGGGSPSFFCSGLACLCIPELGKGWLVMISGKFSNGCAMTTMKGDRIRHFLTVLQWLLCVWFFIKISTLLFFLSLKLKMMSIKRKHDDQKSDDECEYQSETFAGCVMMFLSEDTVRTTWLHWSNYASHLQGTTSCLQRHQVWFLFRSASSKCPPPIYKRKECLVFHQSVTTTDVMQKSCGFLKIYNPIIL